MISTAFGRADDVHCHTVTPGVSADELLAVAKAPNSGAPTMNRRLYRQLQNIEKLPKRDQQALLRTINAFLAKAS